MSKYEFKKWIYDNTLGSIYTRPEDSNYRRLVDGVLDYAEELVEVGQTEEKNHFLRIAFPLIPGDIIRKAFTREV
ncbi:MAG: hypothetical protein LUH47_10285 [Clostridiales bacterium]|nr:hypothetical protein [Clostridiales bacterium]